MKFYGLTANWNIAKPPILHFVPKCVRNLISQKLELQKHLFEGAAGGDLVQSPTWSITIAKTSECRAAKHVSRFKNKV